MTLLALAAEDQKARMAVVKLSEKPDQAAIDALSTIDRKTTARMKEVIAAHGWPGKKLVGDDGANAAWLLVQHADLDVLEKAVVSSSTWSSKILVATP